MRATKRSQLAPDGRDSTTPGLRSAGVFVVGDVSRAILGVTAAPVRAEPSHRSERVTEWLCGEVLQVLQREDDWIRGRGPDGYEGWVTPGSVCAVDTAEADEWQERATLWSLGTDLVNADFKASVLEAGPKSHHESVPTCRALRSPWGGHLRPSDGGRVILPDGTQASPRDPDRLVPDEERADRYPAAGPAVVRSALAWLGAPYTWGGRRRSGVDCSGLVQAVHALHGVALPRDSGQQREVGRDLAIDSDRWKRLERGDLLFFAPEGRGITHVAIYVESGLILHAAASNGCVAVDDLRGPGALGRRLRDSIVAGTRPPAD